MADHPHLETFRRVYEAFSGGDMATLRTLLAEDVVWHTPGRHPIAGDYTGRQATLDSFERELELSGGTYAVAVHDVLANDAHTVALLHVTAEREQKRLDQDYALVFHIRDGVINEAWELWTDQAACDRFWSDAAIGRR
ncbi:MAG: nuclear transport factor 2 family protein [Micromonosporaceae bacterium]